MSAGRMVYQHALTLTCTCHMTNIYGFIPTSTRPIITKPHRMVDWHALTLTLHMIMTLPPIGHRTNIYGFISTFTKTMIIKLGRIVDQHALTLPYT